MRSSILTILVLFFASLQLGQRNLKPVTACELFKYPSRYDGKIVSVRGMVEEKQSKLHPGQFYIDELQGPECKDSTTGRTATVRIGLLYSDEESSSTPAGSGSSEWKLDKEFASRRGPNKTVKALVTVIGKLEVGKDLATKRLHAMGRDDGLLANRPYKVEIVYRAMRDPQFF
jgi:hypothetical protein